MYANTHLIRDPGIKHLKGGVFETCLPYNNRLLVCTWAKQEKEG